MTAFENMNYAAGIDRSKPDMLFAALQTLLSINPNMIFVKDLNPVYAATAQ